MGEFVDARQEPIDPTKTPCGQRWENVSQLVTGRRRPTMLNKSVLTLTPTVLTLVQLQTVLSVFSRPTQAGV